jgi:hypothetical protein
MDAFFLRAGGRQKTDKPQNRRLTMSIDRIPQRPMSFNPEAVELMGLAYEATLRSLRVTVKGDPLALFVAKRIIGLAGRGMRDPDAMQEAVLRNLH